jgi:hypothetical protein
MGRVEMSENGLKNVANNRLTIRCRYLKLGVDSILTDQIGVQTTMKSFRRISMGYFVALAAMALYSVSASAEVRHNSAIVRAIRGSAEVSSDKGRTWKPASVGSKLNANSAILNSLLMALNERVFRRGRETRKLPAMMFVGASNHLPQEDALRA